MSEPMLSRTDLVSAIADKTRQSPENVAAVVKEYEVAIAAQLEAGGEVRLPGFGIFKMTARPGRTGRNLHTGEALQIAPRSVVKFVLGKALKEIGAAKKG